MGYGGETNGVLRDEKEEKIKSLERTLPQIKNKIFITNSLLLNFS
jgi:hypothetical protein